MSTVTEETTSAAGGSGASAIRPPIVNTRRKWKLTPPNTTSYPEQPVDPPPNLMVLRLGVTKWGGSRAMTEVTPPKRIILGNFEQEKTNKQAIQILMKREQLPGGA